MFEPSVKQVTMVPQKCDKCEAINLAGKKQLVSIMEIQHMSSDILPAVHDMTVFNREPYHLSCLGGVFCVVFWDCFSPHVLQGYVH